MNIEQYISTPEVKKILYYWRRRYSTNCTLYTKEELLAEAYLGAWETILKYHSKPFQELLKLISLGVKWKLCNYISKQSTWKLISVTEHIEEKGHSNNIEGNIYVKGKLDSLDIKEKLIVTKTLKGYTMPEIGKSLNISKQRVFQLLRKCGKDEDR